MERLTKNVDGCNQIIDCGNDLCKETCEEWSCEFCPISKAIDKLADYEEAEEQGLLLRLPCKVGDTVYKLWYKPCHNGEDYPDSYSCCGCEDECDLKRSIFDFTVPSLAWILQHIGRFGEGVWYLKREEAEQALKRKESK